MRTLKKTLALVLVLAMMFSLCAFSASAEFTDADEITYVEAAGVMAGIGVIEGMPDGSFDPTGTLTRAQAATMIVRLLKAEDMAGAALASFDDVPASHWAAKSIAYCVEAGIIDGYGNGKFGPSDPLTGYQWAKMLLVALGSKTDYTGAAWQIAVAKDANEYGLFAGNLGADKTAPAAREEAALYALNAAIKGTDVTTYYVVNGESNAVAGEVPSEYVAKYTDASDAYLMAAAINGRVVVVKSTTDTMLDAFGVTYNPNAVDAFGRPATSYTGKILGDAGLLYVDSPIATFTAATSQADVFSAIGATGTSASISVYDAVAETTASKTVGKTTTSAADFTGNGKLVEVYNVGTAAAPSYKAVAVPTSFVEVTVASRAATKTVGAYTAYTFGGNTYKVFSTVVNATNDVDTAVVTGEIANGDKAVAYVVGGIAYISAVDTITGVVSAKAATGAITVGGKTCYLSSATNAAAPSVAKEEQTLYVDAYGYILGVKSGAPDADVFAMVIKNDSYQELVNNKVVTTYVSTIVNLDGTVETVKTVDGKTATAVPAASGITEGTIAKVEAGVNGTHLTAAEGDNVTKITKGNSQLQDSILANAATKFIFVNYDANNAVDGTVNTITGIANVETTGTLTKAWAFDTDATSDGIANVVLVYDKLTSADVTDTYVYVKNTNYVETAEGYTYEVIIAGEDTTITVSQKDQLFAQTLYSSIVDNGTTTTATPASENYSKLQNKGGLLFVNGSYNSTLKMADTAPIYMIDKYDDTCVVTTYADQTTELDATSESVNLILVVDGSNNILAAYYVYTTT